MESSAKDLLTGEVTADTRTEDQLKLLDHLKFMGNNGWHDSYARRDAPKMLAELRATGIEPAIIWGTISPAVPAQVASSSYSALPRRLQHLGPGQRRR
jgi:hypothetical protein